MPDTTQVQHSRSHSTSRSLLVLVEFLGLCYAVAILGAITTMAAVRSWYPHLVKPSFNPPNWVFAPVWTVLYTLMAVAAWLVWKATRRTTRSRTLSLINADDRRIAARKDALAVFAIQLTLNLLWTQAFFHLHRLLVSSVVILALWIAIAFTIVLFWRIRTLAGAIMLPYLAWVTFATALNLKLLRLN